MQPSGLETLRTDVLVVGCGAAGARAAYEAKRRVPQLDVLLVCTAGSGNHGSSGLLASESLGINAPLNLADDDDCATAYLKDMLSTGAKLADERLCRVVAKESAERIRELIALGVLFDGSRQPRVRQLSGCTRARSLTVGGATGQAILAALLRGYRQEGGRVLSGIRAVRLLDDGDGGVVGVLGLHAGNTVVIRAQSTILATGGAGRLFSPNVNAPSTAGDGWGMALRAGARLKNLEFFQIGPGVVWPRMRLIVHGSLWRLRPVLRNGLGKEFLQVHCPPGVSAKEVLDLKAMSFPFSVRTSAMYLDIALYNEIIAGHCTRHGGVLLDLTHARHEAIQAALPCTADRLACAGVDLSQMPVEIAPLVQSFNGGIEIDDHGYTGVPGLWAAGEVSGGVHGADRPGGNNLTDTQVFGYRAGVAAAEYAASTVRRPVSCLDGCAVGPLTNAEVRALRKLGVAAYRSLGVVRSAEGIKTLLAQIAACRRHLCKLTELADGRLLALEAVALAALVRQESRGTHYREDHPRTDAGFEEPIVITFSNKTGQLNAQRNSCVEEPRRDRA